ncbi:MAG: hypothetical protein H6752_02075 [Candidatus Omnitrophica bacterium]|nr:hypothetical protein [Candidatus Omnitrophota bacterium]
MKLEFCPGTLKEMTESDLLETIDDGDIDVPKPWRSFTAIRMRAPW